VFIFEAYAAGVVSWSGSRKMTRLRPLLLGCCAKVEAACICVVRILLSVIQRSVGIFVLGW
jgi:hypothetical protein